MGQASAAPHLTHLRMVRVLDLEGCDGPVCLDGLDKLRLLRYLSLRGTGVAELPETIVGLLHLTYLNLRDTDVSELPEAFGELRSLKTLDLRSTKVTELPRSIVGLLDLTCLNLGDAEVSELPEEIGELRSLQTLDLRSTKVKELPLSIVGLLHLTCLNLRDTDVSELPEAFGELRSLQTLDLRSTNVKELPRSIVGLQTLVTLLASIKGMNHLIETATMMPGDIQHCQRLETLGTIDLREQHASFVEALGRLGGLRVLEITWSSHQCIREGAYCKALLSSIENWSQLEYLTIHCGFGCSMEFMGSLSLPPERLKKFEVTAGRFVDIPKWISALQFLSFLQITVCRLDSDGLRILGGLPALECLILGLEFVPRKAIVVESAWFFWLKRLSINCPVPWLTFSEGAMPKLTYLQLKFCSGPASSESVPSGIGNLQGLAEVVLCYNQGWCGSSSSVKMTIEAVKKEVSGHCNPIKLIINDEIVHVERAAVAMEEAAVIHSEADGETEDEVFHEVPTDTWEIEEIEEDS